jgi:hypothetical protein
MGSLDSKVIKERKGKERNFDDERQDKLVDNTPKF